MIQVETATPPAATTTIDSPSRLLSLADLSRNASVISSESSDSSSPEPSSSLLLTPPRRLRPIRTFSSPRSQSPGGPTTPRSSRPPAYISRELGYADNDSPSIHQQQQQQQSSSSLDPNGATTTRKRAPSKSKSRPASVNRPSRDDFEFGDILGEGSYSTVIHVTHKESGREYACKVLDKQHLKRHNKLQTALAEKNTLVRLSSAQPNAVGPPGHPGIVRLHYAFQDEWSLFFVIDLARNGELQSRISRMGSLSTACARYYAAQVVDALDYMHSRGVIHRDLKPENLLLDDAFRLKVTDFGTGKLIDITAENSTKTFVGTAQYVSPELLEANETSKSSDLWALGCVLYQMIAGRFAFQGLSEYLTWQKIKMLEYSFPEGFDEDAKDLVTRLLVRDPLQRLGAGPPGSDSTMAALRAHPFFAPVHWQTLWTDAAPPLETGLVRRDMSSVRGSASGSGTEGGSAGAGDWDDVGQAWDDLVGESSDEEGGASLAPVPASALAPAPALVSSYFNNGVGTGMGGVVGGRGDDGIPWAPDAVGTEYTLFGTVRANYVPPEEVGPRGELPDYALPLAATAVSVGSPLPSANGGPMPSANGRSVVSANGRPVGPANGRTAMPAIGEDEDAMLVVQGNGAVQFQIPFVPETGTGVSVDAGAGVGTNAGTSTGANAGASTSVNVTSSTGESVSVSDKPAAVDGDSASSLSAGTATTDASPVRDRSRSLPSEAHSEPLPAVAAVVSVAGAGQASVIPPPGTGTGAAAGAETSAGTGSARVGVPAKRVDTYATSSSDGSPVEKLGQALDAMRLSRGRHRTRSPMRAASTSAHVTQPPLEPDWSSVLAQGERMLFDSEVEETVMKRRTSRLLLPLPVAPRKPKVRQLVLTDRRLVCLKQTTSKAGGRAGAVGIKSEYGLRPSGKEKEKEREKEERCMVTGVAIKGGREFVVFTTVKSAFFVAQDEKTAEAWVTKISEAAKVHERERKPSSSITANGGPAGGR